MKVRFKLAVLLLSIVGTLGVASPAMAQGGGGGGGGGTVTTPGCAYFNSWTTSVQTLPGNTQPTGVLRVGVYNGCVDEGVGAKKGLAVSETFLDTATGKWLGASVYFANLGQNYFNFYFGLQPLTAPSGVTLKFTVTRPNGQLQEVRYTTPEELLASVQPAA